jgi:hypothetical protein
MKAAMTPHVAAAPRKNVRQNAAQRNTERFLSHSGIRNVAHAAQAGRAWSGGVLARAIKSAAKLTSTPIIANPNCVVDIFHRAGRHRLCQIDMIPTWVANGILTPRVLSRIGVTWMAIVGVPLDRQLGHTDPPITIQVYAKHRPDYLKGAIDALTG